MPQLMWLWVKNRYPQWNPGKWKRRLTSAVPCQSDLDARSESLSSCFGPDARLGEPGSCSSAEHSGAPKACGLDLASPTRSMKEPAGDSSRCGRKMFARLPGGCGGRVPVLRQAASLRAASRRAPFTGPWHASCDFPLAPGSAASLCWRWPRLGRSPPALDKVQLEGVLSESGKKWAELFLQLWQANCRRSDPH